METETGARTRRLILVLIDYRLKQDLLKLFQRIETAIETANGIYPQNPSDNSHTGDVSRGSMVGNDPRMETPATDTAAHANGSGRKTANRRTPPNSSGGARNTPISQPDK
jgi:hypothetical protein